MAFFLKGGEGIEDKESGWQAYGHSHEGESKDSFPRTEKSQD